MEDLIREITQSKSKLFPFSIWQKKKINLVPFDPYLRTNTFISYGLSILTPKINVTNKCFVFISEKFRFIEGNDSL